MRKYLVFLVFIILFGASTRTASASLLHFTNGGEIYWNVLGIEDSVDNAYESALEVKKIADKVVSGQKIPVSISNKDGKVLLSYGEDDTKPVDITGYKSEIVEIEEKNSPRVISIAATDSGFAIKQRNIIAETTYPITVNSPDNRLTLSTSTGSKFIGVLPYEATDQIIKTNIITSIPNNTVSLVEKEEGELSYVIDGEKSITVLNIFSLQIPIKVEVSATTGTVTDVSKPLWYSVIGFLLA